MDNKITNVIVIGVGVIILISVAFAIREGKNVKKWWVKIFGIECGYETHPPPQYKSA